jgi:hypothetical protein
VPRKRKNRGGRPNTGKNALISIRWPPPLLRGIERYAEQQMLDRAVALRQIVTRFLIEQEVIDREELQA